MAKLETMGVTCSATKQAASTRRNPHSKILPWTEHHHQCAISLREKRFLSEDWWHPQKRHPLSQRWWHQRAKQGLIGLFVAIQLSKV